MRFIEDIWQSLAGNTKAKINDPFIGAFIASWIACNWSQVAILLWGEGSTNQRVNSFSTYLTESKIFSTSAILVLPLLLTCFFVFIFPWFSLIFKALQKKVNDRLHIQAVLVELDKIRQQEELNKARLMANPDKQFLEQGVQLDIDRRKEILEQLKHRTAKRRDEAEIAATKAVEAKSAANLVFLDNEMKQQQAKTEQEKFQVESAILKATLAAQRFPAAYAFMQKIEEYLLLDGIRLSLNGLGNVVSTIFGYHDFQRLLNDKDFNNDRISKVVYIYYRPKELAESLEQIVEDEDSEDKRLTVDSLFDNIKIAFDDLPQRLISDDEAETICRDYCERNRYTFLEHEGLSGVIAESDTTLEEIEIEDLESLDFNNGLSVVFNGSASGSHRKHDFPGRDISVLVELRNSVQVGTRALGEFEVWHVSGAVIDHADEGEYS
ncbi:MAG: cell envelope integrity protein TolA [Pseudomonas sp.]